MPARARIRIAALAAAPLLVVPTGVDAQARRVQASPASRVQAVVDSVAHDGLQRDVLAGMVVIAVRGRDTLLARAYGRADVENDVPMTVGHVFQLASNLDLRPVLPLVLVQAFETRIPGGQSRRSTRKASGGLEFRLPTGAQWEYVGRAGTVTATSFGAVLGTDQANFVDGHRDGTHSRVHRGCAWIAEGWACRSAAARATSRLAAPTTSASRSPRSSADGIDAGGRADRASRR